MKKLLGLAVAAMSCAVGFAAPFPITYTVVGTAPVAAAYSPVTHFYYVANNATNDISILAGAGAQSTVPATSPRLGTLTEIARVPVGAGPAGVAVHAKTGLVYVSNQGDNTVSVVTGATGALVAAVSLNGKQPWGLAVDSDSNRLCVADFGSNQVEVLDTTARTRVAQIAVPGGPIGVAAAGGFCYVTSFYTGTVSKIDLSGLDVVASGLSVPGVIGAGPQGISLTPDGSMMFVANAMNDSVSKINPINLGVIQVAALAPGAHPTGVAASASVAYVSEYGRNKLATVSTASGAAAELISGDHPTGVAVGGTPECAVVANNSSETAGLYCDQSI